MNWVTHPLLYKHLPDQHAAEAINRRPQSYLLNSLTALDPASFLHQDLRLLGRKLPVDVILLPQVQEPAPADSIATETGVDVVVEVLVVHGREIEDEIERVPSFEGCKGRRGHCGDVVYYVMC